MVNQEQNLNSAVKLPIGTNAFQLKRHQLEKRSFAQHQIKFDEHEFAGRFSRKIDMHSMYVLSLQAQLHMRRKDCASWLFSMHDLPPAATVCAYG